MEADLYKLPPFYAGMLHSYSKVNDLYYKENKKDFLPQNLWATNGSPSIHPVWKRHDLLLLSNLPVNEGKTDLTRITTILSNVPDTYLMCCRIQKTLGNFINHTPGENPPFLVNPQLLLQAKVLTCSAAATPLSLAKWEEVLHILPLNPDEHKMVF